MGHLGHLRYWLESVPSGGRAAGNAPGWKPNAMTLDELIKNKQPTPVLPRYTPFVFDEVCGYGTKYDYQYSVHLDERTMRELPSFWGYLYPQMWREEVSQ